MKWYAGVLRGVRSPLPEIEKSRSLLDLNGAFRASVRGGTSRRMLSTLAAGSFRIEAPFSHPPVATALRRQCR